MLHDDENKNRFTPADFAAFASLIDDLWLISSVKCGFNSPNGSFDKAARWMIASISNKSSGLTHRMSLFK